MKLKDILAFPDDIVISLLVVWIRHHFVIKLDTACCNSLDRPIFIDILKHKSLSIKAEYFLNINWTTRRFSFTNERRKHLYLWLCCREIKVSHIILFSLSNNDHTNIYNDLKLNSIRSLGVYQFKRHENIDICTL